MEYKVLSSSVELQDQEGEVTLLESHWFEGGKKVISYITEDDCGRQRYWRALKDPEKLTDKERHEVLSYCISEFDDDEIVNYLDLFLHGEFIEEVQ